MSNFAEMFAALNHRPHELDWSECEVCHEEVPNPTLDTLMLKQNRHVCRKCSYGPEYSRLAKHVDERGIYAAVLKRRYWVHTARNTGAHASKTAGGD